MNLTTVFLFLLAIGLILLLTWLCSDARTGQEDVKESPLNRYPQWCYGCEAWTHGSVEQYWYYDGSTHVLSQLCFDCAFERHATLADENGFPTGQSL